MKTLALMLLVLVSVNSDAAVSIWDTTSFSDLDPWELNVAEVVEEPVVVISSGSFSA